MGNTLQTSFVLLHNQIFKVKGSSMTVVAYLLMTIIDYVSQLPRYEKYSRNYQDSIKLYHFICLTSAIPVLLSCRKKTKKNRKRNNKWRRRRKERGTI